MPPSALFFLPDFMIFVFVKYSTKSLHEHAAVSEKCAAGKVALGSSLQSEWHGVEQAVVIENKDSYTGAVFEAKRAGSALGYWVLFSHLNSLQDYSNAFDLHLWEGNI